MQDDDGWGNGYDDEVDPLEEAIKEMKKEKSLRDKMEETTIRFQPSRLVENQIPQILGVMTDWVPVNMSVDTKQEGQFFITCQLPKDFEHRFLFRYDDKEIVDQNQPHSLDQNMQMTNTIFVGQDQIVESETEIELKKHTTMKPNQISKEMKEIMLVAVKDDDKQLLIDMQRHECLVEALKEFRRQKDVAEAHKMQFDVEQITEQLVRTHREYQELSATIQ